MKNVSIPVDISSDIMLLLNESEQDLKNYFQLGIAIMLFREGKLTLGKAIQLSGLTRYEFEKNLIKRNIPIIATDTEQVFSDLNKMENL